MKYLKNIQIWLIIIILIGFYLRLYKIDNPVADWHSWRQADTASVARSFFRDGFNPLYPRGDDMSDVSGKGLPNYNMYRFVEFPIYPTLVYFFYLLNSGVDERLARLVSIGFSLGSLVFIYLITARKFGKLNGLVSAGLFAVLPYNIYYSRVILPEPSLVFFSLGMFYFIDRWIWENKKNLYFLSVFFTICAFLTKPTAVFFLLPHLYTYYIKEKKIWPIPKRYFALIIPSILPILAWRYWISFHPEGIPASGWLLNGNGIRFRPAFWKWIVGDRFGREILGPAGTFLFIFGLIKKTEEKGDYLLHLFAFSSLLFLVVFATGNVQHDYYQTFIVPALVIFVGRGFLLLLRGVPGFLPRIITIPLAFLLISLTIYLTWNEVKGLYQINNPAIVEAGKAADAILPKDARVVAPYLGDTSFLYQTNRSGWPFLAFPVKDLIDRFDVKYYISTAKDAKTKWVMRKYTVLLETDKFVIIDLTKYAPHFDMAHDLEPN